MERTNIYLSEEQLTTLRRLGEQRGRPVAELIREAVDSWLESQGVRLVREDDWQRRFKRLLARRQRVAGSLEVSDDKIERDVQRAVEEVRRAGAGAGAAGRR